MDFYTMLDQLLNPTSELGGAPGGGDTSALAQLILGGGSASVGSPGSESFPADPVTGRLLRPKDPNSIDAASIAGRENTGTPIFGSSFGTPSPSSAPISNSLQSVLENASAITDNLQTGAKSNKTLLSNPYGRGSYDPNNETERQAVLEQGKKKQDIEHAREILSSPSLANLPKDAQGEIVSGILSHLGVTSLLGNKEQKQIAVDKAKKDQERVAKAEEKATTPLGEKAPKYIHKTTGLRATPDMTYGDVTGDGSEYLAMSLPQEKTLEALNNLKVHTDLIEPLIGSLSDTGVRGINTLAQWLKTQGSDDQAVILNEQLKSMTPIAVARSLLGSGGRAGPGAAKMLTESNVTGADTPSNAKKKISTLHQLMYDLARDNSIPTAPFEYPDVKTEKGTAAGRQEAPPQAVAFLRSHPEKKNDFKSKYGYLPEGM